MRKLTLLFLALLFAVSPLAVIPPLAAAQAGDPWALIAEVNALRASYGLAPLEVDGSLMAAAQSHSEYQASIGTWTHTGPGGTRPHDRAVAAGYGGGAQVYVSENVALGSDLSPQDTVYQMWQDAVHLETMISPNYRHIGAGAATAGGMVYYTIDVGYIAGEAGKGPGQPPNPVPGGTPGATPIAMIPIQVATPEADGSIIHVVQYGQFLINIAKAYDVKLADMLAVNGISQNTVIYPGDKLLVKAATTPGVTPGQNATVKASLTPGTQTPTQRATPTIRPTRSLTPAEPAGTPVALAPLDQGELESASAPSAQSSLIVPKQGTDFLLVAVLVLAVLGAGLLLMGNALKRSS
jgi:LysM repeat protein